MRLLGSHPAHTLILWLSELICYTNPRKGKDVPFPQLAKLSFQVVDVDLGPHPWVGAPEEQTQVLTFLGSLLSLGPTGTHNQVLNCLLGLLCWFSGRSTRGG